MTETVIEISDPAAQHVQVEVYGLDLAESGTTTVEVLDPRTEVVEVINIGGEVLEAQELVTDVLELAPFGTAEVHISDVGERGRDGKDGKDGKDGADNLFVQPDNPNMTIPGLWIQTGLGPDGLGITFWVEDGG